MGHPFFIVTPLVAIDVVEREDSAPPTAPPRRPVAGTLRDRLIGAGRPRSRSRSPAETCPLATEDIRPSWDNIYRPRYFTLTHPSGVLRRAEFGVLEDAASVDFRWNVTADELSHGYGTV